MLKKSLLLLPILSLFLVACQHGDRGEYSCPYSEKSECKKAEKGKSCDKYKKKSDCKKKRKSKDAVGLIFPVNNSKVKGWVHFQSIEDKKVVVKAEVSGLKPNQKHGFHIHQYGDCRENGKNVGVHFNPYKDKHGAPDRKAKHLGDLGNLKANKDGLAFYQKTMKMCVKKLIGRSLVVHAGTDDLKSQPSGKSGTYIGCGVIGRLPQKETSKTLPPVKTVSDKKDEKKEDKKEDKKETKDSKAAPPVKAVSDKKDEKKEDKKEDKKDEKKESKKEDKEETKDSKAAPPVKTVSDKKDEKKEDKKEDKKDEKKEDKKEENNKATEKSDDKKEDNSNTPSATVVKGKAKN